MKKDIHLPYYPEATIRCGCGKVWKIGSTQPKLKVEICAACHPFFTGEGKYVDTLGRVERFERMMAKAKDVQSRRSVGTSGEGTPSGVSRPKQAARTQIKKVARVKK